MGLTDPQEKRLKRGLHDLSPLFQNPAPVAALPPRSASPASYEVQFLSVLIPDHEGDAFLANAYLASQLVRRTEFFASLISIAPGLHTGPSRSKDSPPSVEFLDPRIFRIHLAHQDLWTLTQNGSSNHLPAGLSPGSPLNAHAFLVFLEFELAQLRSLAKVALLLDRVVLYVQPHVESLREAYRQVKMLWNLNRKIEFFLLFRDPAAAETRKEFLFEGFSLITSRFLGLSPGWLGELVFPRERERPALAVAGPGGFHPASLISAEGLARPLSPEKMRFWQKLQKILQAHADPHESNACETPLPTRIEIASPWQRLNREELREFIQLEIDLSSN